MAIDHLSTLADLASSDLYAQPTLRPVAKEIAAEAFENSGSGITIIREQYGVLTEPLGPRTRSRRG